MASSLTAALTVASSLLFLAACGGGGGSSLTANPAPSGPPISAFESSSTPAPLRADATKGLWQTGSNPDAWDPMTSLPESGTGGLRVERAPGARVVVAGEYADVARLVAAAEPILLFDPDNSAAWARLLEFEELLIEAVRTGYKQWARHLRPQTLTVDLQIGDSASANCGGGHSTIGCYIGGATNKVVITENWLLDQYRTWRTAAAYRRGDIMTDVFFELVHLVTHEAGHQFGYRHPQGTTDGCGNESGRCHAPYGSGSVLSYDHRLASPTRYAPTKEDVEHIVGGRWNGDPLDRYTVFKFSRAASITSYGYWLDHEFFVTGWTGFGSVAGGNGLVRNEMMVQPFVNGTPSASHGLRGNATWSGDFVGFDLHPEWMTALTADAALRYSFTSEAMTARLSDFTAWDGDERIASRHGSYSYRMACVSGGCAVYTPGGALVTAEFYRDGADPAGYAAGVVNDYRREYAGAYSAARN